MNQIENSGPISNQDLMILGLQQVAYIKPILVDGHAAYAVHAADGTEMAVLPDREVAFATVRRHDLEPLSVH